MRPGTRLWLATAAVGASLILLFLLPRPYFVVGTFGATGVMIGSAYFCKGFRNLRTPNAWAISAGLVSAALLYGVFLAGNSAVRFLEVPGAGSASESAIYSLIASPSNPLGLQVGVLLFDAVGYESFFRGALQEHFRARLGVGAAPAVALVDAALHLATLNLLWVVTTFIADLGWGLTYYYGRGLQASMTSHFAWDIVIFIVLPIV